MDLAAHILNNRAVAESVCQRLTEEINKLGFATGEIQRYPHYDEAEFILIKDPYTGSHNLSCSWHDEQKKQCLGKLQFNSDDTFYAEYDVVKPHPTNSRYFVEGVTAWGSAENIKAEAKLLPMLL
jgi:hypothetical protein